MPELRYGETYNANITRRRERKDVNSNRKILYIGSMQKKRMHLRGGYYTYFHQGKPVLRKFNSQKYNFSKEEQLIIKESRSVSTNRYEKEYLENILLKHGFNPF